MRGGGVREGRDVDELCQGTVGRCWEWCTMRCSEQQRSSGWSDDDFSERRWLYNTVSAWCQCGECEEVGECEWKRTTVVSTLCQRGESCPGTWRGTTVRT